MNRTWKISQYCENPQKYDLSNYQDVCSSYTDGEVSVMTLCAGASTGMHSHIGAACIAEFSAGYFAEHFDAIYNAEFNVACAEITNYHQAMISHLANAAFERKNVQILVGRTIQIKELNKFASSVQILAVKDDKAIYFKVGNGSAAVASGNSLQTLSDSAEQPQEVVITTPNPIFVLINCDFKTFTLSPSCNAISLATDGVEFENGLFFEHDVTPFYQKLIEDICDPENDPEEELKKAVVVLLKDNMNTEKDNIGISVMHREPLAVSEPEPSVEITEEILEEEQIPLVEVEDDIIETISMSEIIEETTAEATTVEATTVETTVETEVEEVIVEDTIETEIEEAIVEETVEPEIEEVIVEETVETEIEEVIVEDTIETEVEEAIVEDTIETEAEEVIVEDTIETEIEEVIVEDTIETEIEEAIVEETVETEIEEVIVEETVETEIEEAIVEETVETEIEEAIVEETIETEIEEAIVEETIETEDSDFETSFFPEEQKVTVEETVSEEKPKISVKTNNMKAAIGTKPAVSEKEPKKASKLFKFFNISITKK